MTAVSASVRRPAAEALDGGERLPDPVDGRPAPSVTSPVPTDLFADLPLEDGMPPVELQRGALRAVVDPELGYDIVDLGLVYEVARPRRGQVTVVMTLTSVGCPLADVIDAQVRMVLLALPGVETVDLRLTFTPPWSTGMMSDRVREELVAMGMRL